MLLSHTVCAGVVICAVSGASKLTETVAEAWHPSAVVIVQVKLLASVPLFSPVAKVEVLVELSIVPLPEVKVHAPVPPAGGALPAKLTVSLHTIDGLADAVATALT